jgi:hypothetical protein
VYLPGMMKAIAPTIAFNRTNCDSVNIPRLDDEYAGDAVVNPQPTLKEGEKAVFSEYVCTAAVDFTLSRCTVRLCDTTQLSLVQCPCRAWKKSLGIV